MSTKRLPQIDSVQELAHFWDTHDLTDFERELEEVPEQVFESETVIEVHLPGKEAATLKEMAETKGVPFADLIRQWVLERVHGQ